MTYELTVEEKTNIINQHLKNLEYSKYNLQVSLLEAESNPKVKEGVEEDLQSQLDAVNAQQEALIVELNSLQAQ